MTDVQKSVAAAYNAMGIKPANQGSALASSPTATVVIQQLPPVVPGTDMTADELRLFYAKHFTVGMFPDTPQNHVRFVATFNIFWTFFKNHTDSYMFNMVALQESKGYDVPTLEQASADGWLTPIV